MDVGKGETGESDICDAVRIYEAAVKRYGNELKEYREAIRLYREESVSPLLVEAIKSEIGGFCVQWRLTNDSKPHVVFKLAFRRKIEIETKKYSACLLFMSRPPPPDVTHDYTRGDHRDRTAVIKLVRDTPASDESVSTVAFKFAVHGRWTLQDVTNGIRGRSKDSPPDINSDLRDFEFMAQETNFRSEDKRSMVDHSKTVFHGHRDWASQLFVRLHFLGWVDWGISGTRLELAVRTPGSEPEIISDYRRYQLLPERLLEDGDSQCPAIDWTKAGFHDIIGKKFHAPIPKGENHHLVVYYQHVGIRRGFWGAERHSRMTHFYRSQRSPVRELPYDYVRKPPLDNHRCPGACSGGSRCLKLRDGRDSSVGGGPGTDKRASARPSTSARPGANKAKGKDSSATLKNVSVSKKKKEQKGEAKTSKVLGLFNRV